MAWPGASCGTCALMPTHLPLLARLQSEADGTLPMASLESEEKHALVEKADAKAMGYEVTANNYCSYPFCKIALANKKMKCGEGQQREQERCLRLGNLDLAAVTVADPDSAEQG